MGRNLFDDYEEYRLYQELHGDDDSSNSKEGDGCFTIIMLAVAALIIQSLF